MIRINLLKPLETPVQPLIFEEPAKSNKKKLAIYGGVMVALLILGAFVMNPTMLSGLFSKEEEKITETVAPPVPQPEEEQVQPKPVTAQAVEETVRDMQPDAGKPAGPATYADLVPSQKIEFQYYASARILKDIKAITPPDVGFANFIFTPPGDFYVHGLAGDAQDLERFQQGLNGLTGADIKPGMNVAAGARGKSKEFSFFGSVKYPVDEMAAPPDRVVDKAELQLALKQMKTVAGNLGIRLKEPKLFSTAQSGNVKKLIYQTAADCSFQQMQDFLSELHESKSNLGFIKFSLHASGDEKVVADMDILAYVEP